MSGDEASYAPRSPDLSSFSAGAGPTQPQPPQHRLPPSHSLGIKHEYAYESTALPPHDYARYSHLPPHQVPPPGPDLYAPRDYGAQPHPLHYQPTFPAHEPNSPGGLPYQGTFHPSHTPTQIKAESEDMPPRRAAAAPNPVLEPSPVRTKFPTARIKRIMQADEEVGKVAQQTPIAVGKALEMFMIQLVMKSAEVAKDKGSKRVTAPMLKQVVETDEQWDFLREIVSRVEQEREGGKSKLKAESESEEEPETKKKRGPRKKKGM